MEEVGLITALNKWPCLTGVIFPLDKERNISSEELKAKVIFEEKDASELNSKAAEFFVKYIELMQSRKEGKSTLNL